MTERTLSNVERENAYLKLRVAQPESDPMDLPAESGRLREGRERLHGHRAAPQAGTEWADSLAWPEPRVSNHGSMISG